MEDEQRGWRRIKNIKIDRKRFARRMRKAEVATQRHAHRFILRRLDNARLVVREITAWLLLIGLLIAGLGLQLIWGQQTYTRSAAQPGGLYVEGALGPINSLNPLFAATSAESSVARLTFSSLYSYDTTGTLHTDLATAMQVDSTHQIYTVSIRNNARWQDGEPLTAQDVVFTINLIKNPAVRSPLRINWLDVSASAANSTTVQFKLPAPYAAFPYALTFPILPQHLLKDITPAAVRESAYSQAPVGSGPFILRRLQNADSVSHYQNVHFVANTEYYAGAPKLSRFELHAYPDETSLVNAANVGELSGATDISVVSLNKINRSQFTVTPQAIDSGVYLLFNNSNPILSDVAVRRALQVGTDTAAIRSALIGGVLPLDSPLLSGQVTGNDVPHAPAYNLKLAGEMLDKAGWVMVGSYRVKDNHKLELTITTTNDEEFNAVLAQIKDQWRSLGVKVNTNVVDTSSATSTFVQNTLQGRNFDILLYELAIGADPDVYAYWHSSQIGVQGYNFANYSNTLSDASLATARTQLDEQLRNAKYKQFVQQWLSDAPAIGLYQPVVEYLTSKGVSAVNTGTHLVTEADRYANVGDWTVTTGTVYKTP